MDSEVAALARRLEKLEHKIWGDNKARSINEPLVKSVSDLSTDVGNSLAGHDRITPILKRLDELEMYLDPVFGETSAQNDRVKQSIVLSQENQIQQNLDSLEKMKRMTDELSGDKIGDIAATTSKLEQLHKIQLEERQYSDSMNKQTLDLIEKYNTIIANLNDAFVQAESEVAAAEEKQKRPVYY
uniref:Dynactin subunit 6 n=1 Tax=Acartia pacifica TaxID=335913 RepID=A0A0U2V6D7_ACAPC|nr:dynactin subunit 6 [Acartia pacifica]